MGKSKAPAFQMYPGDWLSDSVAGCSLAAQGLWLRMMFVMHNSEPYGVAAMDREPMTPEALARRCGCGLDEFSTLLDELDRAGVPSRTNRGAIYSRRMVRDELLRAENRKRQTNFYRNHKKTKENPNANLTPIQQPSSSSTSSSKKEPKPSRSKAASDERHVDFRQACQKYAEFKRVPFVWDGSEAKALDLLLKAVPDMVLTDFQRCINHRQKSVGVTHGDRPRLWLPNITKYAEGPLDEFGKVQGASNGKTGEGQKNRSIPAVERRDVSRDAIRTVAAGRYGLGPRDDDGRGPGGVPQPGPPAGHGEHVPEPVGGDGPKVRPAGFSGRTLEGNPQQ